MKHPKIYENYQFRIRESRRPHLIQWNDFPWHLINYVQEGHGILKTENVTLELNIGDLYYIPQGLSYTCHWTTKHTRLRSMAFRIFPDAEKTPFAVQKLPQEFVDKLYTVGAQMWPTAQDLGRFYTILGQLVPSMAPQEADSTQKLLDSAKKLMSGTYMRWSIAGVANYLKVSESTLYLAFQKLEGRTPNQVRHEYVINEAIRLLTDTDNSISKISDHLGFSSDTYFRKVFKDHTGKSPRQVRKESKQNGN